MKFEDKLRKAQAGDNNAVLDLFKIYKPLLIKHSIIDGVYDENLFQELSIEFLLCIKSFRLD